MTTQPIDIHAVAAARKAVAIWTAWAREDASRNAALALLEQAVGRVTTALQAQHSGAEVSDEDRTLAAAATSHEPFVPPVVAADQLPGALAWLAAHTVAVVPRGPDYRQPFDDAGYVIISTSFDVTMEDLAALTDPSDAEVWALIEPGIYSRAAHWDRRRAGA